MDKLNKPLLVCFCLIGSMACSLTKEITVPPVELPVSFAGQSKTDSSGIAELGFKDFFAGPCLQSLIDSAVLNNYDVLLAVKNLESAELVFKQVKYDYFPQADLQIGESYNRNSENSLNGRSVNQVLGQRHIEDYNAQVGLRWEADIWGKIRNRRAREYRAYLQTVEARKAVQTKVVAEVATGYYNLLMLDAQLRIARRNLKLADSSTRIVKLQFAAGQVSSLAVQQITVQGLVAAKLIPELEQNVFLQENALSILTGQLPSTKKRELSLEEVQPQDNLRAGLPSKILSRRADVRGFELAVDQAHAGLGMRRAEMYPSLAITASGGVNAFQFSNWFTMPASLFGSVLGNLSQPLIQGKKLRTQYDLAKINLERSVLEFRQSVLVAVGEVSDALVQIDRIGSQRRIAVERVTALEQAVKNSSMLFKNGMANYLEVITAQSNALEGELELATIKRNELNARVSLYRSLGGGWTE